MSTGYCLVIGQGSRTSISQGLLRSTDAFIVIPTEFGWASNNMAFVFSMSVHCSTSSPEKNVIYRQSFRDCDGHQLTLGSDEELILRKNTILFRSLEQWCMYVISKGTRSGRSKRKRGERTTTRKRRQRALLTANRMRIDVLHCLFHCIA